MKWAARYESQTAGGALVVMSAHLPKTQYRVERRIRLDAGARHVVVDETVENLLPMDRPFQWMEHATFGQPFVEPGKTVFDVSATRGLVADGANRSLQPGSEVNWPRGVDWQGKPVDLRAMQTRDRSGAYVALRLDPTRSHQFFTMFHPDYRVLIGYTFPSEGMPWIADWQENRGNAPPPWNNQAVARGIEFGNSPFAEGLRKAIDRGALFDTPAYEWIPAFGVRQRRFTIFLEEIPAGFPGVRDVDPAAAGGPRVIPVR